MWANAMREILTMLGDAKDEASEAIRREAKEKLAVFLGWLDGTVQRPSDEERRELVRETTTLYRKARTHASRPAEAAAPPDPPDELSDESHERMVGGGAPAHRPKTRSASGE